jgi:amidase
VPAGFHTNGRWPLGLQLIGRPRDEAGLLRLAAGWENAGLGAPGCSPFTV